MRGAHHRLKLTNTTKDNEPKDNAPTIKTTTQQNNHPTPTQAKQHQNNTQQAPNKTQKQQKNKAKPPKQPEKHPTTPPSQNKGEGQPQLAGPEGFEPSANGLRGHRSNLAELRTHSKHPYCEIRFKSFSPPSQGLNQ